MLDALAVACIEHVYRVMLVVWQLGWVEIDSGYYTTCWAAGVMAEWAEPVSRLVELENLSQHNQLTDRQTLYKHMMELKFTITADGALESYPRND